MQQTDVGHNGAARHPAADLGNHLHDLRNAAGDWILTWSDGLRSRARNLVLWAALGAFAALLALLTLAVGVGLALTGAAQAIASGLNWPTWAGFLIVGVGVLVLLVGAVAIAVGRIRGRWMLEAREAFSKLQSKSAR